MKTLSCVRMFLPLAIALSLPQLTAAQSAAPGANAKPKVDEVSPAQKASAPPSGPIVDNWNFKNGQGHLNLSIDNKGYYVFSGEMKEKRPGKDFHVVFLLENPSGAEIAFHYVGDAKDGVRWSKMGHAQYVQDNFASFATQHHWAASYKFVENKEGIRDAYEKMEKKREKIAKEEEEARKKKDEKLAAEKRREQQQLAQEQAQQAQQQAQSGGGDSVLSTVQSVVSVASTIGQGIANIVSMF